jgi:hypothetical protein
MMVLGIDRLYIGLYEKKKVGRVFAHAFDEDFADDRSYATTYTYCSSNCMFDLRTTSFGYAIAVVNFIYNVIRETANLGGGLYLENTYELSFSAETTFEQWKWRRLGFQGVASSYTEMNWDRDLPPIPLLAITSLLL